MFVKVWLYKLFITDPKINVFIILWLYKLFCLLNVSARCSVDCAREENLQKLKRSLKRLRRMINDNREKFAIQWVLFHSCCCDLMALWTLGWVKSTTMVGEIHHYGGWNPPLWWVKSGRVIKKCYIELITWTLGWVSSGYFVSQLVLSYDIVAASRVGVCRVCCTEGWNEGVLKNKCYRE